MDVELSMTTTLRRSSPSGGRTERQVAKRGGADLRGERDLRRSPAVAALLLALVAMISGCSSGPRSLRLATTTSTEDSGLLDVLLPVFEDEYGIAVEVIAVGSGQAIALGEAGDVDVVLVHSPAEEAAFVDSGFGVDRRDVMANDFVLLGPASDPAGIVGGVDITAALARIADSGSESESVFVSRGDDSGTHAKERDLWAAVGVAPAGGWYRSIGQGMGETLTVADEEQAYTLSDRATYAVRSAEGLESEVMVEGDPRLSNPYGAIAVNPDRHDGIAAETAAIFLDWLTSPATREAINAYRPHGQQLFFAAVSIAGD